MTADSEVPKVPDPGANRQALIGGVVVVVTLAIAAWLAYGVVQRSATSPRAAGLVPDGSVNAASDTVPGGGNAARTATSNQANSTTSGSHATTTTATFASETPAQRGGVPFDTLWRAYSAAWIGECNSIWKHSTNGKLYDSEDPGSYYTVSDCTQMLDKLFVTADVTSVAIARREGASDAASFTAQLTLSGKLCWIDPATDQTLGCWSGN